MKILLRWIINALVLLGIAFYVPGIEVDSFYIALILAFVLAILNLFFKPILVILTLPITILTLGLFTFLINGFLFWFASSFVKGFEVASFGMAILGSLIYSIVSYLTSKAL